MQSPVTRSAHCSPSRGITVHDRWNTHRTGSGCSTAAQTLSKPFGEIALQYGDSTDIEHRKLAIAIDHSKSQWIPFSTLTVSSVIFSFLLQESQQDIEIFLGEQKISDAARNEFTDNLTTLLKNESYKSFEKAMLGTATLEEMASAWRFYVQEAHVLAQQTKKVLGTDYPPLFQKFGDNVRFSGTALDNAVHPDKLFALMARVCILTECAAAHEGLTSQQPTRVVIDAIRNPLELVYLRQHLPGLYVIAITVDDDVRKARLLESGLSKRDVDRLDEKEYPESKHLQDYSSFVSQNLKDCIQKSDIFVANPGVVAQLSSSVRHMNTQLVRYVALALRPGLITPTRDERCMQIAFVAKLNSGCISRQVGAVVADSGHSIHSIGWNDTPKGQTACLLRDVGSLLGGQDDISFSEFEKTDPKLRSYLDNKFKARDLLQEQKGLSCPFCFKDAYNAITNKNNQIHTRSLHAEENAFLQVAKRGGSGIEGGVLYTTASPCELCSKKAYQLGIKDIVYVDPYPGISTSHVLRSGAADSQPRLRLFSGAVGHAYHRLYEAILSIKDEYRARLEALGVMQPNCRISSDRTHPISSVGYHLIS
jgi:deoxycytidylate deaminase